LPRRIPLQGAAVSNYLGVRDSLPNRRRLETAAPWDGTSARTSLKSLDALFHPHEVRSAMKPEITIEYCAA
jgi:hypothetical protein